MSIFGRQVKVSEEKSERKLYSDFCNKRVEDMDEEERGIRMMVNCHINGLQRHLNNIKRLNELYDEAEKKYREYNSYIDANRNSLSKEEFNECLMKAMELNDAVYNIKRERNEEQYLADARRCILQKYGAEVIF